MNQITATEVPDRVKTKLFFDPTKLQKDVNQQDLRAFVYYNVIPLTAPKRKPDIPANYDYADGSWATWHDQETLRRGPYLTEVVNFFRQHADVTLVRLLRLAPGALVKEHTDPTLGIHIERSVIRLTVPIKTNDQVIFYLNKSVVPMKPGECWYMNLADPHYIENHSQEERINLTIDMRPNEWVRSLINVT